MNTTRAVIARALNVDLDDLVSGDAANEWNIVMATAILAMIPPAMVVLLMQKWFIKGLVDTEK